MDDCRKRKKKLTKSVFCSFLPADRGNRIYGLCAHQTNMTDGRKKEKNEYAFSLDALMNADYINKMNSNDRRKM